MVARLQQQGLPRYLCSHFNMVAAGEPDLLTWQLSSKGQKRTLIGLCLGEFQHFNNIICYKLPQIQGKNVGPISHERNSEVLKTSLVMWNWWPFLEDNICHPLLFQECG